MKRIASTIVASMALVSAYAMSGAAQGAERPNVLIMGEDIDRDSIRRGSQAFNRTLNAIATEMQKAGYKVYDETAITLEEFKQGRIFRRNDELIDIAKSVREAPIDVVVIFSIFPEIDRRRHTTRLFASVTGRMVDVNNGRRLGNFTEKTRQQRNVAPDCSRECLVRYFSAISEEFGQEVGRVLSFKLAAAAGLAGAYKMEFVDFSAKDITEIEEFLTAFSGYQRHRVMQGSSDGRRVYWYETSSDKARLNRNLRLMLDHIGIHGRLKFEQNSFIVTRLGTIR
ncbi:MAG: hypothetical protein VB959_01575 [Rhodospirillales bacterium]